MAQKGHPRGHERTDTLDELLTLGDRIAHWVQEHATLTIVVVVSVLVGAAATGGYISYSQHREEEASAAVSAVRSEFVQAMGGSPGAAEIPEPANPETARSVRLEFAERFLEVAREHGGTTAAALAALEAGDLLIEAGETERALEVWQEAAPGPGEAEVRGALLGRIAAAHEAAGRFAEAAQAHAKAGALRDYPLRDLEQARAAWAWLQAGETEEALATYRALRDRAPDFEIPEHLAAPLRELDLRSAS